MEQKLTKEEQQNRDVSLVRYAKKLLLPLQKDPKKQTKDDETYLAALIALSKLSSPLSVELMVQESILTEDTIAFLLRLMSSYLHHKKTNISAKEDEFFYLSISIQLLHYVILSSVTSKTKKSLMCMVTNLVHKSTPSLLQVLQIHSSLSSKFNSAPIIAIDTQIVEILHCILVYYYLESNDEEDLDSNQILVPILVRYRSLVADQCGTSHTLQSDQTLIISQYRTHLLSILHYILHNDSSLSSFLHTSSHALVQCLDLALTHDSTLYHLALQWCKYLFRETSKITKSSRGNEDSSSWSHLVRNNATVQTLFSNCILFGFQHYYNSTKDRREAKKDDRMTSTSTDCSREISCDLFETIALALEHIGGIWAIQNYKSDQNVTKGAVGSTTRAYNSPDSSTRFNDSLLTLVMRMASGELRIVLGLLLAKGRFDHRLNSKDEVPDTITLLANTTLHCTRIIVAVLKDLIEEDIDCDSTIKENESDSWVHLLHFETILNIKQCTEDAMHAMFQFVAATVPISGNFCVMMESEDLTVIDSVTVLCIKCLKLWLRENEHDNATIIPTTNEHEKSLLCALMREATIDASTNRPNK